MCKLSVVLSALIVLSALMVFNTVADAQSSPAPLQPLPADKLAALGPLLQGRDVALIEREATGALKQLTTLTLVAAPPELVREVIIHPERYPEFVRNMEKSHVQTEPGGTLLHEYLINYRVYKVDGRHRYVLLPKGPNDAAAPVEMYDPDRGGVRHYRWEFLPAGGATVLALYGYTKIPRDGFSARYLERAPTLEYGFALIPQMTLLFSMKARAEALSGGKVPLPSGPAPDYDFLLERGAVALLYSSGGRLREVNVVERSSAPAQKLIAVAADPAHWSAFIPSYKRTTPLAYDHGLHGVETQQSLPLMSWTTSWAYRANANALEMVALDGDLRGSRLRWDARPRTGHTEFVLRAMVDFRQGCLLLKEVYKLEPYLEYGFDVALNLLLLQSVRWRAEAP